MFNDDLIKDFALMSVSITDEQKLLAHSVTVPMTTKRLTPKIKFQFEDEKKVEVAALNPQDRLEQTKLST